MSYLSLHIVPRKPKSDQQWEEHAARQKLIRLRSLQEDADSFISKYESEVREPTSFWVNRLKDPTAWTILMVRSSEELPEDGEALLRENVEWVAFCVMIDARQVTEVFDISPATSDADSFRTWLKVTGTWLRSG